MFMNDLSGHQGGHWQYPGTWIGNQQNPYGYGWNTIPQNFYGVGGNTIPYLQNIGTQNTGWTQGQTWPHTMINHPHNMMTSPYNIGMHPYNTGMQSGLNYNYNLNTTPFTNTYLGQGYTPFHGNLNNPFLGCR